MIDLWGISSAPATHTEVHHQRHVRCYAERPANIDALFRAAVKHSPDRIALVDGKYRVTYADLEDGINGRAAALITAGLTSGDRIALLLENGVVLTELVLAAARCGDVLVQLSVRAGQAHP